MRFALFPLLLAAVILPMHTHSAGAAPADDDYIGRWDITVSAEGSNRPRYCWLEISKASSAFKGRFNQGGGAVFPLPELVINKGELVFQHPIGKAEDKVAAVYRARLTNGKLEGTASFGREAPRKLTGVRAPKWPIQPRPQRPGDPIELFNGRDMSGWLGQNTGKPAGWSVKDGAMVNEDRADNIYSEKKFRNFRLEVEFNVAPGSNSGIYLRGRYEIQVMDGAGRPLDVHSQGALYGFAVPTRNAERPADEWQKFEITLIGDHLTVVLNGTRILDDIEVPGITGGALDANESDPGPIMLQGDHGPVQYRKVTITPYE
jgi:hypothetical protein